MDKCTCKVGRLIALFFSRSTYKSKSTNYHHVLWENPILSSISLDSNYSSAKNVKAHSKSGGPAMYGVIAATEMMIS